ncbi:hypothetical protein IW147_000641 [Coemansia sp. RSA 720]|nr:hypothetical protein IW147_000641 [Coemansia sp. RSA 720]
MHSYRTAPPGSHAPSATYAALGDPDSDDDHVPLGAMVAPGYDLQLELELEQQQQQFQQQYLQQYRQMQMQPQPWTDDAFSSQHTAPGFQSSPHNPNLPPGAAPYVMNATQDAPYVMNGTHNAPYVMNGAQGAPYVMNPAHGVAYNHNVDTSYAMSPAQDVAYNHIPDASCGLPQGAPYVLPQGAPREFPPGTACTTVLGSPYASTQPCAAPVRAPNRRPWVRGHAQPTMAMHEPEPAPSSSSDSSSSSDESAYGINSDEEVPIAAANTAPAPVSRHVSARRPEPAADSSDDDLPLSIISASSSRNHAHVRRTKTVAPMPLSPRSQVLAGKSRSMHVRPHPARQTNGKSESDEDAPLDRLKAALASGARPVPNASSRAASIAPSTTVQQRTNDDASEHNAGSSEVQSVVGSATSSCSACESASDVSSALASGHSRQSSVQPSLYSRQSSLHSRQLSLQASLHSRQPSLQASLHSRQASQHSRQPSLQASLHSRQASLHSRQASLHSRQASLHSRQSSQHQVSSPALSCRSTAPSSANSTTEAQAASRQPSVCKPKAGGYLPTGTALPGLPLKRRSLKPRAAVQYIAMADIVDTADRVQGRRIDTDSDANIDTIPVVDIVDEQCDAQSVRSFATASSSGGTIMDTLRTGPVQLLTASTEHSGSKASVGRVVPEDYGDIDQLLTDLDGIMNGSLAARRRFSLALMRRSLAVSNDLVEPTDYSYHDPGADVEVAIDTAPFIEFKPLEIADVGLGAEASAIGDDLGLGDLMSAISDIEPRTTDRDNNDDDSQPLDRLAAKHLAATSDSRAPMLATSTPPRLDLQLDLPDEPKQPVELSRTQKIQKALEKLDLMNVRKVSIRIYVQDARRYYTFALTEFTTSEMIINDMKKSGIIDTEKSNWALFELVDYFGIERPLNHYENLMTVVESWEPRSNNYIIAKGFSQQAALTLLGGVHPGEHSIQGMLYYRVKRNKWQKGVFRLLGHNMLFLKDSRGKSKKDPHYLTLTNNDVYTPFEPLRGSPTRYVFGLKSEMPMQMFEKPDEDYVKWFAVQTLDSLCQWLQVLRFSKNQLKFCHVLERRVLDSSKMEASENNAPSKPLVDLTADKHEENDDDDESAKNTSAIVSALARTATATKHDPAALLKIVEQHGIDVSDFNVLSAKSDSDPDNPGTDEPAENLFLPGSLLSRPKKSAAEMDANQKQVEAEMYAKGSLLAQPRESKALAASRAMQSVMAQGGNVFSQGSLLQITDEKKSRPAHIGGAAHIAQPQFPLVQMADMDATQMHSFRAPAQYSDYPAPYAEENVVFGGMLASESQTPQHPGTRSHPFGQGRQHT